VIGGTLARAAATGVAAATAIVLLAVPAVAETDVPPAAAQRPAAAAAAPLPSGGVVTPIGKVGSFGGPDRLLLDEPVIDAVATASGRGYYLLAEDGGVFTYGDATFLGSTGGRALFAPVRAFTATPDGRGYYFVAEDGGVFSFGAAPFYGSLPAQIPLDQLVAPVIGMVPTSTKGGYWLVAEDGGVFTYGDAPFLGSLGGQVRDIPIVGMAGSAGNRGYWLIDEWGQVFPFGDAGFFGFRIDSIDRVADLHGTPTGKGYWVLRRSGKVEAYGDAVDDAGRWGLGSTFTVGFPFEPGVAPVAVAADPGRNGIWIVHTGDYRVARGVESGAHSFIDGPPSDPTRWNPCVPIGWYYDPAGEPFGAQPRVAQAFQYLAEATGLVFQYRGTVSTQRGNVIDGAIIVHWESLGGPAGLAGPRVAIRNGRVQHVAGEVMLDPASPVRDHWYGPGWGIVMVHEIAHAIGLAHVPDRTQVMFPVAGMWRFGDGDLEGLRRLGAASGCL
jgi:hypothetical protein